MEKPIVYFLTLKGIGQSLKATDEKSDAPIPA
jgi:hypothetical protein